MKQCKECGTFSSDDTVFCSVCGKRFLEISNTTIETSQIELQYSKIEYNNQSMSEEAYPEVKPLLQRIGLFLEDGEFDRADEYCERVLDIEPTNAEAYIGKLLVEYKCSVREQLKNCISSIAGSKNYAKVIRYGNEKQKAFVVNSEKSIQERIVIIANKDISEEIKVDISEGRILLDGVYQYRYPDYSSYLRFFADGKVVGVSSIGTPSQVGQWLNHDYESFGFYTIKDGTVSFRITSSSGQVRYSGRVLKNAIELNITSHINGYSANNLRYSFCSLV